MLYLKKKHSLFSKSSGETKKNVQRHEKRPMKKEWKNKSYLLQTSQLKLNGKFIKKIHKKLCMNKGNKSSFSRNVGERSPQVKSVCKFKIKRR